MGDVRESTRKFALKVLTKLFRKPYNEYTEEFVELRDQQANDYVRERIHQSDCLLLLPRLSSGQLHLHVPHIPNEGYQTSNHLILNCKTKGIKCN